MVVTRHTFDLAIEMLMRKKKLSFDTETLGLRPYHGERLFSLIIGFEDAQGEPDSLYFNFWPEYENLPEYNVLPREWLQKLKPLFECESISWYVHKSNFDTHVLGIEGIEIKGTLFCTLTQGRVAYNEHMNYSLESSLERIGLAKDDKVEEWIAENRAYDTVLPPGKTQKRKNKHFERVPWDIIVPYGEQDAKGCFALGQHLEREIESASEGYPEGALNVRHASQIEQRLAHTVYRMEKVGVKIDRAYIERAVRYEDDRSRKACVAFKRECGRQYAASPLLFAEVFASEKDKWAYTEKGNPSFESDALRSFESPAAKLVLEIRDAKSRLDFYQGFLWHADSNDVVHPQFNPGNTRTFRFASSEPNFQNLTSEDATVCRACKKGTEGVVTTCSECGSTDVEHPEFLVRRAIIPRPGYILFMPDFSGMEYAMLLDYAKSMMIAHFKSRGQSWDESYFEVANKVRDGFDVHKATAEMMGVSRKYAKTLNFLLLYGGGPAKLAAALGISLEEATRLRDKYFRALPYVQHMIGEVTRIVKTRGWIRNWAGYKYHFPNRNFAYTGPNTLIQGGCAAVTKVAMNSVDELLLTHKSKLTMTVHDEICVELSEDEAHVLPKRIVELMEKSYPYKHVPMRVDAEWSAKSLADKVKGLPA